MSDKNNYSKKILEVINTKEEPVGITSSPSNTLDIVIDITEAKKAERALGQMVYVGLKEDAKDILVIGQIISVETKNRWHEDPSFKGVIKRHGKLPHLSGTADNRIATISVQACYLLDKDNPEGYILGTSPSTGENVKRMDNDVMCALMKSCEKHVTYMGKVYGTDVDLPFWFKHFDKTNNDELGANDAYHIGVFGRTGSGKTVTASFMMMGYAKNKKNISILVLDPQRQFYLDSDCLPNNEKLETQIRGVGMNYKKYSILEDICLPGDEYELFAELLANNGFIREAFRIFTDDKIIYAKEAIVRYLMGRYSRKSKDNLNTVTNRKKLLQDMLGRFNRLDNDVEKKDGFSKYISEIYSQKEYKTRLTNRIQSIIDNFDSEISLMGKWDEAIELFNGKKGDGSKKNYVDDIVEETVNQNGNFIVLDLSGRKNGAESENLPALFIRIIESKIVEKGSKLYADGKKANCLIVMDEAHRFISQESEDERIKELTSEIIGSVRTTRKYGIGYMFITQTIESLDDEILKQMRIFGFGYGLTAGSELRKVSEIVNNEHAIKLYRSFIDPSSNNRYPFMFFGPISPLSFTGSPLFIEVYKDISNFK